MRSYFALSAWLLGSLLTVQVARAQSEFDASGSDVVRIEKEDKLLVPNEIADEVWNFLKQKFVEDAETLRQLDPDIKSHFSEELFFDTYFDTPTFRLYDMKSGVRHRARVNLTNENDRKSGRELIQIKLNSISADELQRAEIKYNVLRAGESPYSRSLLDLVQLDEREPLARRLKDLGLPPESLKPVLTIRDVRRRIYLAKEGKPFISISFDQVTSRTWWATAKFVEIEPELNEIQFTEASAEKKAYMTKVGEQIAVEIQQRFPQIKRELTPKYNKAFDQFEAKLPFFRPLVRAGLHTNSALIVIVAVIVGSIWAMVLYVRQRAKRRREDENLRAMLKPEATPKPS